jgi:hypothetical protein
MVLGVLVFDTTSYVDVTAQTAPTSGSIVLLSGQWFVEALALGNLLLDTTFHNGEIGPKIPKSGWFVLPRLVDVEVPNVVGRKLLAEDLAVTAVLMT